MKAFATSGDADYRRETIISPYTRVEGRHLQSCFHDPMHVLFLGTCRGLFSSSLAYIGSGTITCTQGSGLWMKNSKGFPLT